MNCTAHEEIVWGGGMKNKKEGEEGSKKFQENL